MKKRYICLGLIILFIIGVFVIGNHDYNDNRLKGSSSIEEIQGNISQTMSEKGFYKVGESEEKVKGDMFYTVEWEDADGNAIASSVTHAKLKVPNDLVNGIECNYDEAENTVSFKVNNDTYVMFSSYSEDVKDFVKYY